MVLAVILPRRGAFIAPVQLTVVAQEESAEQIARVTFDTTDGGPGTLLMANWSANSLLPRIARANRLDFFTPDHRLLHSVTPADFPAALDALNHCRGIATNAQYAPISGSEHHVIDVGLVPQSDRDGCGIRRMTRDGNDFGLRYTRREGMTAVYGMHNGPRHDRDEPPRSVLVFGNRAAIALPSGSRMHIVGHDAQHQPRRWSAALRAGLEPAFRQTPIT